MIDNKIIQKKYFEVTIEQINHNAEGVARLYSHNDAQTFLSIPYTLPNEIIITNKDNKNNNYSLNNIIQKSPDRIDEDCKFFFKCGGCLLQHWNFKKYLDWKFNLLSKPISKISPKTKINNIHVVKKFTRRRAKLFAKKTSKSLILGFKKYKSNNLVNINQCIILHPQIIEIFQEIKITLNHILQTGDEINISINMLDNGLDILLRFKKKYNLYNFNYLNSFDHIKKISRLSFQYKNNEPELLGIFSPVSLSLEDKQTYLLPPPGGFFQATKFAEKVILESIFLFLKNSKKIRILDLFSGCGTISLPLLNKNHFVSAIDINGKSIEQLVKAAKEQNLFNKLETHICNLMKIKLEIEFLKNFDVAILNPPRSGARLQYFEIAEAKIPKIISISCNVKTFLSDCKTLIDKGYKLKSITPIDQFLYTGHLETIAIFEI